MSSSPAKLLSSTLLSEVDNDNHGEGNSKGITRRNMMIVDDSEASENEQAVIRQGDTSIQQRQQQQAGAENEAILTESESDEENARPAQRVDPRRLAGEAREVTSPSRPPNNTRENETLGEARATISAKNTQITELKHRLDKTLEELATTKQTSNNLNQEVQIIETRLREQNIELLNEREQVKKLKEDKKGLSKTLRIEVDRVSNLNSTNRKLLDEITLLKQ